MIKTVYALDVAAKHVVEIPLQAPTEEERAKLSENGKYLATAVCESRDDGTFALVPRLYGAAKGSLLATYEFPALSDCTNAAESKIFTSLCLYLFGFSIIALYLALSK